MDPSHLFWHGIDAVAAIERLGRLVYNAAAKDTRINQAVKINGVLDAISLGGHYHSAFWHENSS